MRFDPGNLFFVIFGLVAVNLVYRIVKNRGFKGAMFGAPVGKQIGELELQRRGLTKTKLKIHVLAPRDKGEGPNVGIEVIQSTVGSWQMRPVAMTRAEALRLAEELSRAAAASDQPQSFVSG